MIMDQDECLMEHYPCVVIMSKVQGSQNRFIK